jgi:predicted nucleotidyltransferase component of viral defense system
VIPRGFVRVVQGPVMNPTHNLTRESWKQILASAVTIFDDLEKKGFGRPAAVIGGGTVLMFRFDHRLSKDIDFFTHDLQWVSLMTPRLNDTIAAMVTDYVEQANGIKLMLPHGDIDFVAARAVTAAEAVERLEFMGRTFFLEPTEEILAKKLFYRAARFQSRDVFDLAAAIEFDAPSATNAVRAAASKAAILERRLDELDGFPREKLERDIVVLDRGRHLIDGMVARTRRFIREQNAR